MCCPYFNSTKRLMESTTSYFDAQNFGNLSKLHLMVVLEMKLLFGVFSFGEGLLLCRCALFFGLFCDCGS